MRQARAPAFYAHCGVADTVDGRFDMIALHVFLILRRLRRAGDAGSETAQALFDAMFEDMDRGLREMGAGDLGVGRRVKAMAKAFYGRVKAYDEGLAGGDRVLEEALVRNLYRAAPPEAETLRLMSAYMRREAGALDGQDVATLLAGGVAFGPPPVPGGGERNRPAGPGRDDMDRGGHG